MPLLLIALTLAGCSSAPKQPLNVLNVAKGEPSATIYNTTGRDLAFDLTTYVTRVDGKTVPYKRVLLDHGWSQPVKVPPGPHSLHVVFPTRYADYHYDFDYTFLAGHAYRIKHAGGFDSRLRMLDLTAHTSEFIGPKTLGP